VISGATLAQDSLGEVRTPVAAKFVYGNPGEDQVIPLIPTRATPVFRSRLPLPASAQLVGSCALMILVRRSHR